MIEVSAPSCIEVHGFKNAAGNIVMHFINCAVKCGGGKRDDKTALIAGVEIKTSFPCKRCVFVREKSKVKLAGTGQTTVYKLPPLGLWDIAVLDLKEDYCTEAN